MKNNKKDSKNIFHFLDEGYVVTNKPDELLYLSKIGIIVEEARLILPSGYTLKSETGMFSATCRRFVKVLDDCKRTRIYMLKDEFSIENRFNILASGRKCMLDSEELFTNVLDNQLVRSLSYPKTDAIGTLIYSDSVTVVPRFMTEEQIEMVQAEEKEKVYAFMRKHWPEYENPLAYWTK